MANGTKNNTQEYYDSFYDFELEWYELEWYGLEDEGIDHEDCEDEDTDF